MTQLLKDKAALITGGSRGIGKAIAQAFLKEGASVMLAARSIEQLRSTKNGLGRYGGRVAIFTMDVGLDGDAKKLVAETLRTFGTIDILVNAAGIYGPIGPSASIDFEAWKKTFDVNLFGTFRMMQAVLPAMMKARRGKIINFSGGGDGPFPRFTAYSTSKAAIVRLTESMAAETKEYAIDINAIAPGPVNTAILDDALAAGEEAVGKERYEAFLKQKTEGGVPTEKAAELCVFLASAASDGLTGKYLSAVWDNWKHWSKTDIAKIMLGDQFTLRRRK
jgi:3-oxoacyl-[acyl-carrier protein] reductase